MERKLAASRALKYQHWPGASATRRIAQGGGVRVDFKGENFVFDPLPSRSSGGSSSKRSRDGGTKVETVGVK
jgi:hypothetical protein